MYRSDHQQQYSLSVDIERSSGDRLPQWSLKETRDFLAIRAELDATFMETKRNKILWELVSTRMKEKGYNRNPDQCKCKWKNLVTRYKGFGTLGEGEMRHHFPFFNDLQAIYDARMQRMLWLEDAEGSKKPQAELFSSENDETDAEKGGSSSALKKKRKAKEKTNAGSNTSESSSSSLINEVKQIMEDFLKQQMEMEVQMMNAYDAKEEERRAKEVEWRLKMEALENERVMIMQKWREKEDEIRVREEARNEKRDALISAFLNKLKRDDEM